MNKDKTCTVLIFFILPKLSVWIENASAAKKTALAKWFHGSLWPYKWIWNDYKFF